MSYTLVWGRRGGAQGKDGRVQAFASNVNGTGASVSASSSTSSQPSSWWTDTHRSSRSKLHTAQVRQRNSGGATSESALKIPETLQAPQVVYTGGNEAVGETADDAAGAGQTNAAQNTQMKLFNEFRLGVPSVLARCCELVTGEEYESGTVRSRLYFCPKIDTGQHGELYMHSIDAGLGEHPEADIHMLPYGVSPAQVGRTKDIRLAFHARKRGDPDDDAEKLFVLIKLGVTRHQTAWARMIQGLATKGMRLNGIDAEAILTLRCNNPATSAFHDEATLRNVLYNMKRERVSPARPADHSVSFKSALTL